MGNGKCACVPEDSVGCKVCSDRRDLCTTCNTGFYNANGKCMCIPTAGTFCDKCTTDPDICTTC